MAIRDKLEKQTKEELLEIRRFFSIDIPSSARKSELVDAIEKYLLTETEDALSVLPEYELRFLQALSHLPSGHKMSMLMPYTPFYMALLGLLNTTYDYDNRGMTIWMDEDLREAVESCVDFVIAMYELDGAFQLDRIFFGMLTVYGVFSSRDFIGVLSKGFDKETDDVLTKRLLHFAPLPFFQNGDWICHPLVNDPDAVIRERVSRGFDGKDLKPLPTEYIMRSAKSMPYFSADLDTGHGKELIDILKKTGYEELLSKVLEDIWTESQLFADAKSLNQMVKGILMAGKFESMEQTETFIHAISNYSNSIPKWILGGRSSNEVHRLDPSEKFGDANILATAERLASIYDKASAFPKVGRNDPCPCGSGLKYKNCHGKNQS